MIEQKDNREEKRNRLTGLLIGDAFVELAEIKMKRGGIWCCLAIDIQHFKIFNSWFGYDKGNVVLQGIGKVLNEFAEENDAVAGYIGRDNFCVVMEHDKNKIAALYESVKEVMFCFSNNVGFLPAFGVCLMEEELKVDSALYNRARIAIEDAKNSVNGRIKYYVPQKLNKRKEEFEMLTNVQKALQNDEIKFYVQPQCMITDGKIVGGEALARWVKPDGSIVAPASFVPVLEKYGLIMDLDKYIWEEVFKWMRNLMTKGIRPVPVSVNVSQIELLTMDVAAYMYALAERYNVPARFIKIEITETAYAENFQMVSHAVSLLKEKGFSVCMDDFGAGYSSLNMLDKVNADILKLDMAFMCKEDALSHKGISIVESIISMSKTLGIPVIVEGVETQDQSRFLGDLGCLYAQGYYYCKPLKVAEFEEKLAGEDNVDYGGIKVRSTELFHTREFLNENLFTDTMLNNILGPVAFYTLDKDGGLNINRFNRQFYDCIADVNMESRSTRIQDFIFKDDLVLFYKMLDDAMKDTANGGECTVRFSKSGGGFFWYNMRLFFLRENEQGKLFYGKIASVTDMYQQGESFYELLKSKADYCMRIDLNKGCIYELRKDKPFDDPDARVMDTEASLRITAEKRIPVEADRETFVQFFNPARLKKSHEAGIYSENLKIKFYMGSDYTTTNFSAYYIKFIPNQDYNVYVFANTEK